MRLRAFLILILVGTVLAWASWLIALFKIDPIGSGALGIGLFVILFLLGLFGVFFFAGFGVRRLLFRRQTLFSKLNTSLRQGGFFTALVALWAILQSQRLVRWWNLVLLVLLFATLEFFFVSSRHHAETHAYEGTD
jgi:hypothetical protein